MLLDEPYPANLPVVPSCRACNEKTATDEEYLACLVECAVAGSTSAPELGRAKITRLLVEKPALAARLRSSQSGPPGDCQIVAEGYRVRRVVVKLARGHSLFELAEPQDEPPIAVRFAPFCTWNAKTRGDFESLPAPGVWPEVGSRAMQRFASTNGAVKWLIVQPGRYRYAAVVGPGATVRIVLSEYLACEVVWA